jgi:hypothetical protein
VPQIADELHRQYESGILLDSDVVRQVPTQRPHNPIVKSLATSPRLHVLEQARESRYLRAAGWTVVWIDLAVVVLEVAVKEVVFVLAQDELIRPVALRCQSVESVAVNVAAAA